MLPKNLQRKNDRTRTNVADRSQGEYSNQSERMSLLPGDMHRGQSLVVWAIREGREAASAVG
ncbi:MAG: hypothetical protein ACLSG9_08490 [Eubacterium sp.]